MGKKYLERAARDGRVAILPEFCTEGREIWYWRECWCTDGDGCMDMVSSSCPRNALRRPDADTMARCARHHPVLDRTTIWAVQAEFYRNGGIVWVINDAIFIRDAFLRSAVFPTREEALQHRPEVIEYG